ncbi:Protein YOP1 [Hypsizygus marmoreus]|uniref:Protein YOP1 n=1 Tax=Hypsizygus marmoreus TaxID=39966 RepID=A0A369JTL9_HYPMA|nr:Protein YOP1 [Hypsizygus marmoreus]
MSAATKVQQHPVFIQAQNKANFYLAQLDKEVRALTYFAPSQLTHPRSSPSTPSSTPWSSAPSPQDISRHRCLTLLTILHTFNPSPRRLQPRRVGAPRAIESPSPHDDVQWLTYWVVFGFFNFVESFALRLVLYYLPWYFVFKTLFIVWLQLPVFRGAQVAYFSIIKPVLSNVSHQSRAVAPTSGSSGTNTTTAEPVHVE